MHLIDMEETKKEESDPPPDAGLQDGLTQDWNASGPFSGYVRTITSGEYDPEGDYRHLVPPTEDEDPKHWDAVLASYRGEWTGWGF